MQHHAEEKKKTPHGNNFYILFERKAKTKCSLF